MNDSSIYRWGRVMARRRRAVIGLWAAVLVGCAALYPSLHDALGAPDYGVLGSESAHAADVIEERFPDYGSEQDVIVFQSTIHQANQPAFRHIVGQALRAAEAQTFVKKIVSPYAPNAPGLISKDRHAAIAPVGIAGDPRQLVDRTESLQDEMDRAAGRGVEVWVTGYSPVAGTLSKISQEDVKRAETFGLPVALVFLLFALGAAVAAAVPLTFAGLGLLLTYGVFALLATAFNFDQFLVTIATMIGVGIGIDYALFIVSRFREELAHQAGEGSGEVDVDHAVGVAIATSGHTVLVSGLIVGVALTSLFVISAPIFYEFAIGAATVALCMILISCTLLPAVLAMLGSRINRGGLPQRLQPRDAHPVSGDEQGPWGRLAMTVMRHAKLAASLTIAILLLAAVPLLDIDYGVDFGFTALADTPAGQGQEVLATSFGPGALAPIEVVTSGRGGTPLDRRGEERTAALARELRKDDAVARLTAVKGEGAMLLSVQATTAIDAPDTEKLVRDIRETLAPPIEADGGPEVSVGGATARVADLSDETLAKFPLVLALVLGLSFMTLLFVFRSIVLPIKAVVMNLLATAATVGLTVLVFQEGIGEGLLGFESAGFIQVYLPLTVFALLFGLSTDYEIFLISRMQETWRATHDNELAVAAGVEHTARVISTAAAIMVIVFGSFLTASFLELKEYGFALALAIALDATLIRLVLVPALMHLFGARNWWLPFAGTETAGRPSHLAGGSDRDA
jgi:putative drug exporter of the RND superfamily